MYRLKHYSKSKHHVHLYRYKTHGSTKDFTLMVPHQQQDIFGTVILECVQSKSSTK